MARTQDEDINRGGEILIADDHPPTREGLSVAAKGALPGVNVVTAATVEAAAAAMRARRGFRLVLLDYGLPDTSGFSGLLQLQMIDISAPIAIVSAREDAVLVEAARALGAAGFLFKSDPLDDMAGKIRRIASGATSFPLNAAPDRSIATMRNRIASLSPAQLKVLLALADGRLNKQIAGDLDVSEATVKAHLTAIFRKLGVQNRTQALLAVQPIIGTI